MLRRQPWPSPRRLGPAGHSLPGSVRGCVVAVEQSLGVLLGSLFKQAAQHTQVIASTQSPLLLDQVSIEDVVVVDREQGETVLKRLDQEGLTDWLDEFALGEPL